MHSNVRRRDCHSAIINSIGSSSGDVHRIDSSFKEGRCQYWYLVDLFDGLFHIAPCSNALCFVFDLCGIVGGSVGFWGRSCIDLDSWDSLRDAKTPLGSHIQLVSHFRMRVRAILSLSLLVFFALTSTVGTCIHAGPACGISRWPGRHIWPALSRWKCIVSCTVAQTVAT